MIKCYKQSYLKGGVHMEQITFIVSIISLGLALVIFISNLLNHGFKVGVLNKEHRSSKWAISFFILYIISFALFLFI